MGSLEWLNRHTYYPYIMNNLSRKQLSRLRYIIKNIEDNKLRIYGHIFTYNGAISGIDIFNNFYMAYFNGYEPCGAEIAVFKWMNNLGVLIDSMLYELLCAVDNEGYPTQIGRLWIKAAQLPKASDLCFAQITEVVENGLKVKKIKKANVIGIIAEETYEIELNDILYGCTESFVYITYYTETSTQMLRLQLYVDRNNLLYFSYNNKKIYLKEFKKVGDNK